MTADIFAGTFLSQPLVFAHLWDIAGDTYNTDCVEVICNQDPILRLQHFFSETDTHAIEDALGLSTTCVIVFHTANLDIGIAGTEHLRYVGSFPSLRFPPAIGP